MQYSITTLTCARLYFGVELKLLAFLQAKMCQFLKQDLLNMSVMYHRPSYNFHTVLPWCLISINRIALKNNRILQRHQKIQGISQTTYPHTASEFSPCGELTNVLWHIIHQCKLIPRLPVHIQVETGNAGK